MKSLRLLVLLTVAVVFAPSPRLLAAPTAAADHDKDTKAYDDGYKHGRDDAKHHRSAYPKSDKWKHGDQRHEFEAGYQAGYQSGMAGIDSDNDRNDGPTYTGAVNSTTPASAHDVGYQDGLLDGQNDRHAGNNFRPTDTDNYKHADRGYTDSMGSKDMYKAAYRQGYADGYRKGFKK